MKKIVALLIAFILMFTCILTTNGLSYPYPDPSDEYLDMITERFTDYYREQTGLSAYNILKFDYIGEYELDGKTEKFYIFSFDTQAGTTAKESFERLGIYGVRYYNDYPLFKSGQVMYTESDGQFRSVNDLYTLSYDAFVKFAKVPSRGCATYAVVTTFATDVTGAHIPTIYDATVIQKYTAGMDITEFVNSDAKIEYLDVDNDGDVTIKDATAIQKYIAGLEY